MMGLSCVLGDTLTSRLFRTVADFSLARPAKGDHSCAGRKNRWAGGGADAGPGRERPRGIKHDDTPSA